MRTARIVAVIVAVLGGMLAVLGYSTVIRDGGGSHAALALVFTGILATIGAALAALSHPQDARDDSDSTHEARANLRDRELSAEWRAADDYETRSKLAGATVFWLGVAVLDVLFVLLVIWLFVPSVAALQTFFWSMGRPLGLVVLDVGFGFVLVGYSLVPSSAIRL
jgi:hypothetical protein